MDKIQKRSLKARWSDGEGSRRQAEVVACLEEGRPLSALPFLEKVEGRWDLRGITVRETRFEKMNFADIDFSFGDLSYLVFNYCEFKNVRFDGADCVQFIEGGCRFEDVSFVKADLSVAGIGFDGSVYRNVSFAQADFTGAVFIRPWFIGCDFSEARLRDIDFKVSHFVNCKFKGKLKTVWFRGYYPLPKMEEYGKTEPNPMENVDFSEAELWDVMFDRCDLSKVIPPRDGYHFLFKEWGKMLEKAEARVEATWEGEFKKEALFSIKIYKKSSTIQKMKIINVREIQHEASKEFKDIAKGQEFAERFIQVLLEAEAEVKKERA